MKRLYLEAGNLKYFYNVYEYENRTIYNPSKDLREKQKEILTDIKKVFELKLNTKKSAEVHCGQKWIMKIDIKDFYESFSKMLLQIVINRLSVDLKLNSSDFDANAVYHFCTLNDKLPTGALTSAHIANYAFQVLEIDYEILKFCRDRDVNYSRYMDDMIFSANKKSKLNDAEFFAEELLKKSGFKINKEKTKYISDNKKQEVLGILVNNQEPVLSKIYKNKLRTLIFNYLKSINIENKLGLNTLFERKITFQKITGYMSYLKSADNKYYEKMKEHIALKINKFNLAQNEEIQRLIKVLKLKNPQLRLFEK